MDLQRIRIASEKYTGGLKQLASDIEMTEANLHRCIRLNKIQAGDLENISVKLGVPVSYFFDEEVITEVRQAGRDYVEKGTIKHGGTEYNISMPMQSESDKDKEIAELRQKLIAAQERIISLMEQK